MLAKKVEKDERTTYVENQSYRYGYIALSFGILIDILYRSIQFNEAPWDLFAVIFLGGLITIGHQYRNRILTENWIKAVGLTIVISAIVSLVVLFVRQLI
ncbi:MAG TPA: hypothetical protein VFF80_08700 [Bacillota bacterium]|nr:hypothetical protein [Bacillota bacterium]